MEGNRGDGVGKKESGGRVDGGGDGTWSSCYCIWQILPQNHRRTHGSAHTRGLLVQLDAYLRVLGGVSADVRCYRGRHTRRVTYQGSNVTGSGQRRAQGQAVTLDTTTTTTTPDAAAANTMISSPSSLTLLSLSFPAQLATNAIATQREREREHSRVVCPSFQLVCNAL